MCKLIFLYHNNFNNDRWYSLYSVKSKRHVCNNITLALFAQMNNTIETT